MENVNFLAFGGTTESIRTESKAIDYGRSRHIRAEFSSFFSRILFLSFQSSNVMHGRTKWIMGIVVY